MKTKILLATSLLKCRFCNFTSDDPERSVTIGEGTIKDPWYDLIYYEEANTIEDAVIDTKYAIVECPTLGCSQFLLPSNEGLNLEQLLVKTSQDEDENLKDFNFKASIPINEWKEKGTVMCNMCWHPPEKVKDKVEFSIVYDSKVPAGRGQPLLKVMCDSKKCYRLLCIKKPGEHYEDLVQIGESRILRELEIIVEPVDKLRIVDQQEFYEDLVKTIQDLINNDPETKRLNLLSWSLSRLTGKRVNVVLKKMN